MIERDRFAFAALEALMRSEGDSEVIVDTAEAEGKQGVDVFADVAYTLGDAMLKRSAVT